MKKNGRRSFRFSSEVAEISILEKKSIWNAMRLISTTILAFIFLINFSKTNNTGNNFSNTFLNSDTTKFDKGKLLPGTVTLDLSYYAISCECANWVDNNKTCDTCENEYIFLEQGNKNIIKADTLWNGMDPVRILVTGQFYSGKGFPENYHPIKGDPHPARVFRYKKIKIISKKNKN